MMDTSYCLKCKQKTKNINSKGFLTKNKKYLFKSTCNVCKSKNQNSSVNKRPKDFFQIYSIKYLS